MAVLCGNDGFSILVLSTKKRYCSCCKKLLFSRKSVSKLNYWKRLKFSLIVTKKHANLSNRGLFWKSLVPFFRRTYALSLGFKMKPLRKDQPKFCRKTCLKEQPFIFTIWWITFSKHLFSTYVIMECLIELNPIQDGLFQGCGKGRREGAFWPPVPKIRHTYPTKMKLGTVIPYLRKIQKIHKSRDTSLEFYWHQHFFNGNQQILIHQEIHI